MTLPLWLSFLGVWILASVALGPNAVNCALVSARYGAGKALWAVAGILVAAALYQALVFLGVATILMSAAGLFTALKLAGCAYIAWMGVRIWRSGVIEAAELASPEPLVLARRAFLIALSNPKTILAYAAIFSQFIDPTHPLPPQALVLAPTALTVTALAYTGYALAGGPLRRVTQSAQRLRLVNRLAGSFFVASAVAIGAEGLKR